MVNTLDNDMIENKTFYRVAQASHVLGGGMFVLLPTYWFDLTFFGSAWCVVLGICLALVKEFWYDFKYEGPDERGSSTTDFEFYMLGMALAMFVVFTK